MTLPRVSARATVAATTLLLFLLAGCAVKVENVSPDGRLNVVLPKSVFDVGDLSSEWVVLGSSRAATKQVHVVTLEGVPALRIDSGTDSFALVRRVKARLIVSPYLSWSWYMQASGKRPHPLRLIVGFHGGRPDSRSWGSQPLVWTGSRLPPHDRVLALVWGSSGLQRGSFLAPDRDSEGHPIPALPRYVVRGGPENAEAWRLDTVDLSQLYHKAWPGDDPTTASIVFIGFAYQPEGDSRPPPRGYLSGVVLSR